MCGSELDETIRYTGNANSIGGSPSGAYHERNFRINTAPQDWGFRMSTRSFLRDTVTGLLAATCTVGVVGASHAQVAFWQHLRTQGDAYFMRPNARGLEIANVRADRTDHVQAQIDRMEARARADDRLSGRPAASGPSEDTHKPQAPAVATDPNRSDSRPGNVGPGWQARGRGDGGR